MPGMEIGTQHKYGLNILVDVKPEASPMRPETAKTLAGASQSTRRRKTCVTPALRVGFPLAGLLSEPIKDRSGPAADDGPV